jgi:hypothetical protein
VNTHKNAPRLLGAAFLFVFVASLVSGLLLIEAVGSGNISDMLVSTSDNLGTMQISIVFGLLTSIGIVVLAVLLYIVLKTQDKVIALIALGWWLAEAILLAVSKIGALALIPLSHDFVAAGSPESSFYQPLGHFLYSGLLKQGDDIHMLFYSIGGILWFYLFLRSKLIPRVVSALGLAIESVSLIGMVLLLLAVDVPMLVFYPVAALELIVGFWLLIRGAPDQAEIKQR